MKTCKHCEKPVRAVAMCKRHYDQVRRTGHIVESWLDRSRAYKPEFKAIDDYIELKVGDRAILVDNLDFLSLTRGLPRINNKGYVVMGDRLLHELILTKQEGKEIDHINGNPLDNRLSNLRLCTRADNMRNMPLSKRNTSGFKGVIRLASGSYQADLQTQGKKHFLGIFKDPKDAARAYDNAARTHYKKFARTNEMLGLL